MLQMFIHINDRRHDVRYSDFVSEVYALDP